jgi:hypothetical protein
MTTLIILASIGGYLLMGWVFAVISLAAGPLAPKSKTWIKQGEVFERMMMWPVIAMMFIAIGAWTSISWFYDILAATLPSNHAAKLAHKLNPNIAIDDKDA